MFLSSILLFLDLELLLFYYQISLILIINYQLLINNYISRLLIINETINAFMNLYRQITPSLVCH